MIVTAIVIAPSTAAAGDAVPPFERVDLQKIDLPGSITDASQPAYAEDGHHLLFMANALSGQAHLWIVGEDGSNPQDLTSGVAGEPAMPNPGELEQPALIQPFPDGERVFFGPYNNPQVLECAPSVVDCQTKLIVPVDLSGARQPSVIPAGGVMPSAAPLLGVGARPQISPDGNSIMFSDIRFDAIEVMTLAKLTRDTSSYVTSSPHVLNPAGPASVTDRNVRAWSDSSALFESKSFVDGGRAITYVQVGGEAGGNPDLWKLDLRTGERTRLTSNPDWQEDHGWSPDGKWNVFTIDSRGSHFLDYLSLMPYRSFFDGWEIAAVAIPAVGGASRRVCAPFAPRLLTSSGDDGGRLMGQDLQPYDGGDIRPSGNYQGLSMWKPDGTAVALSTQSFTTLAGAPYLMVALLPTREPAQPRSITSSQPGGWAPDPTQFHGALGAKTDITLEGMHSGTVTLHYDQEFLATVNDTATYVDYSDDGVTFLNGTDSITRNGPVSLGGSTHVISHLTLSGQHTGSLERDILYGGGPTPAITGTSSVTYDGATHVGVDSPSDRCDKVRSQMPGAAKLDASAQNGSGDEIVVTVSAGYKGAGLDELSEDRRPVRGATVQYGGQTVTTNSDGVAKLSRSAGDQTIQAAAGDTFAPTSISAPVGPAPQNPRTKPEKIKGSVVRKPTRSAAGKYRVIIAVPPGSPNASGKVTIKLRKGITTKRLTAALRRGTATVRVPKLSRGKWKVTITWAGDANYLGAAAKGAAIRVTK